MKTLSYYAEDNRKSNAVKRRHKASSVRHKLQQLLYSLVNMTKLVEAINGMPDLQANALRQQAVIDGMMQVQSRAHGNQIDPEFQIQIMSKLTSFEEKLQYFAKYQKQMQEDSEQSVIKEKQKVTV